MGDWIRDAADLAASLRAEAVRLRREWSPPQIALAPWAGEDVRERARRLVEARPWERLERRADAIESHIRATVMTPYGEAEPIGRLLSELGRQEMDAMGTEATPPDSVRMLLERIDRTMPLAIRDSSALARR